jgi:hypothetical protein
MPRSLVKDVVYQNHDLIIVSHAGQKRKFETICLRFWWSGMREDVKNYVKQCDGCQRRKQGHEYRAPMAKARGPSFPFDVTIMDVCVHYPLTRSVNRVLRLLWTNLLNMLKPYPFPKPMLKFAPGLT